MYYRVDLAALYNELLILKENKDPQSSLPESGNLDCRKAANKNGTKRQTGMPEPGNHYKGVLETTAEITSETTSTTPLHADPGDPGCRDFVERCLMGTILQDADPGRIAQAARKYNLTDEEVETAIDVLDQQYRQSARAIDDPTALVVCALRDGVYPSVDYVPKAEREAEAEQRRESARKKADEKRREEEIEEAVYKAADEVLLALPQEEYEEIMAAAKTKIPIVLRDSKKALWGHQGVDYG
jgi:hypothetical protein